MIAAAMRSIRVIRSGAISGASATDQGLPDHLPLTRTMLLIVTLANFVVRVPRFSLRHLRVMTQGGPINRTASWPPTSIGGRELNPQLQACLGSAVVVSIFLLIFQMLSVHLLGPRTVRVDEVKRERPIRVRPWDAAPGAPQDHREAGLRTRVECRLHR